MILFLIIAKEDHDDSFLKKENKNKEGYRYIDDEHVEEIHCHVISF